MCMKIEGVVEKIKKDMRQTINEDSADIDKAMYEYVVFCDLMKGHALGKSSIYPEIPALLKRNLNEDTLDDLLLHLAKVRVQYILQNGQDEDIRRSTLASIDALMSLASLQYDTNMEFLKRMKDNFSFEEVWELMRASEGEIFQTFGGVDFKYEIVDSDGPNIGVCIRKVEGDIVRKLVGISRFKDAWDSMPAVRPVNLNVSTSGSGYIYGILADTRLYNQGDKTNDKENQ